MDIGRTIPIVSTSAMIRFAIKLINNRIANTKSAKKIPNRKLEPTLKPMHASKTLMPPEAASPGIHSILPTRIIDMRMAGRITLTVSRLHDAN